MALAPGTRLGPYEVRSAIGAGGMGEVYRAHDTRLDRDVAIKVLPASVADDPDRRARFEREAIAVASLSHPNILAIFDTGVAEITPATTAPPGVGGPRSASIAYAVTELLEGQTLRERLDQSPLPVRKAIDIAAQVARGLGAAHGKGIVHRDLKPENVFLLEDGQVKILDFGLATAPLGRTGAEAAGSAETMAATDPGTVMGTIGYMAPEQVRAQPVDARADVFSLGAVIYEMVSGQRAFKRETAADTMTAILTLDPPELAGSRPDLSPALDRIVHHCLEKNPNERFQSARDVAFALEALSGSNVQSGISPGAAVDAPVAKRGRSRLFVAGLVVLAAAGGLFAGRALSPAASPPSFTLKTFEPQSIFNARFMPDSETVVFSSALTGNAPQLFEIRPGTLEAKPFGPPRTHLLSISSKGELAILTDAHYINHRLFQGTLARMTIEGAPRPWLDHVREADWSPDGSTLAVVRNAGAKDQLEYPIGKVLYETVGYVSDPRVSPDGTRVAFMDHQQRFDDRGWVKVVDAAGKVTTLAGEFWGEEGIAWTADGSSLIFGANERQDSAAAEPGAMSYQLHRLSLDRPGSNKIALTSPGDFTIHDITPDGRWLATREDIRYGVAARGAGQTDERDLSWLNQSWGTALSSNGQRLLFTDGNGGPNYAAVWRNTDGAPVVRLGEGNAIGLSPDGKWALAEILTTGELIAYPLAAGDPIHFVTSPVQHVSTAMWLADSAHVLIVGDEPGKAPRAYRLSTAGGPPVPVLPEGMTPVLVSPDGANVAGIDAAGAWVVCPLDGGAPRPLAGLDANDVVVAWSTDAKAIFVLRGKDLPARLDRLDIATGRRAFAREFAPADQAGLVSLSMNGPVLPDDLSRYGYDYLKRLSFLFIVSKPGS
jgi:eukaryotic-like serine/threonine-protein kinase